MRLQHLTLVMAMLFISATSVPGQSTAFKYQGSLTDGGNPANGSFQMQFKLFDAVSGGSQIGSTLADLPINATNGVFSVSLDFGTSALNGANRWIEIAVRRNAGESYVTLSPREQIASAPYAVRTLSAATADTALDSQKLGGVNANQFVQTNDARLSDSRNPLPGSTSYIQNQNAEPQAGASFNISGTGTGTAFNVNGPFTFGNVAAPPVAPAGQSRFYFDTATNKLKVSENGAAYVNLVGASGVSGSGTVNRIPFFSAATTLSDSNIFQSGTNIGIGTPTPGSGFELRGTGLGAQQRITDPTSGSSLVLQGGAGGNMKVTGFNYGTGTAQPLYLSTDGANTLLNTNGGLVGIGTASPNTRMTLGGGVPWTSFAWSAAMNLPNVNAFGWEANASGQRFGIGQTNGGLYIFRTNSAFGNTASPPAYDMTITDAGLVGINMTAPTHHLDVRGFFRASHDAGGNVVSETTGGTNSWAKLWVRTPVQHWSIGSSNNFNGNQLYFANESNATIQMAIMPNGNVGIGSTNPPSKLWVDGNVGQRDSSFGLPKAMVEINENGAGQAFIVRCYNAVSNSVSGTCGINVGQPAPDTVFHVTFPFRVTDRFFSLTTQNDTDSQSIIGMRGFLQSDISGQTLIVSYFSPLNTSPSRSFILIVY